MSDKDGARDVARDEVRLRGGSSDGAGVERRSKGPCRPN